MTFAGDGLRTCLHHNCVSYYDMSLRGPEFRGQRLGPTGVVLADLVDDLATVGILREPTRCWLSWQLAYWNSVRTTSISYPMVRAFSNPTVMV